MRVSIGWELMELNISVQLNSSWLVMKIIERRAQVGYPICEERFH